MSKVQIIIASTRPGRVGPYVAEWIQKEAIAHGGFDEVEMVDLAEVNLPFMDEPNHPRLGRYEHQHTKDWSARVASADAFVFVMPEYNYGLNAPLKNALDYLNAEWRYKVVGLASYGGVAAGTRAANMLKEVISGLKMVTPFEAVQIPFVHQFIDEEDGTFTPNEVLLAGAKAMFDEMVKLDGALKPLREAPKDV
ncbi:MAG TPA: NAD(P)H-dependent oxidoreductase [Actinocrinis sp.]